MDKKVKEFLTPRQRDKIKESGFEQYDNLVYLDIYKDDYDSDVIWGEVCDSLQVVPNLVDKITLLVVAHQVNLPKEELSKVI